MRCEQALENLSDYLESRVSPTLRVALENHYSQCRSCNQELVGLRRTLSFFTKPEPVEVPHGFRARVLARAEALAEERRSQPSGWQRVLSPPHLGRAVYRSALGLAVLAALTALPPTAFQTAKRLGWLPQIALPHAPAGPSIQNLERPELVVSGRRFSGVGPGDVFELSLDLLPHEELHQAKLALIPSAGLVLESRSVPESGGRLIVWQGDASPSSAQVVPVRLSARWPDVHVLRIQMIDDQKVLSRWVYLPVGTPPGDRSATLAGQLSLDAVFRRIASDFGVAISSDNFYNRRQPISVTLSKPGRAMEEACRQRGKLDWSLQGDVINVVYQEP